MTTFIKASQTGDADPSRASGLIFFQIIYECLPFPVFYFTVNNVVRFRVHNSLVVAVTVFAIVYIVVEIALKTAENLISLAGLALPHTAILRVLT